MGSNLLPTSTPSKPGADMAWREQLSGRLSSWCCVLQAVLWRPSVWAAAASHSGGSRSPPLDRKPELRRGRRGGGCAEGETENLALLPLWWKKNKVKGWFRKPLFFGFTRSSSSRASQSGSLKELLSMGLWPAERMRSPSSCSHWLFPHPRQLSGEQKGVGGDPAVNAGRERCCSREGTQIIAKARDYTTEPGTQTVILRSQGPPGLSQGPMVSGPPCSTHPLPPQW